MEFRGTVAAVKEPQTKAVTVNGEDRDVTRLRVVAESGMPRPREQADGTMRNERDKSYFEVEGWGPQARALARVNIGEKFNVSGDILEAQPFEKADGTTFYPSHQLRVNNVEFIGVNQAASRDRAASAVAGSALPTTRWLPSRWMLISVPGPRPDRTRPKRLRSDSEVTEACRAAAVYRAQSRVLCRSAIDLGASPAAIAEMAAAAGVVDVRVRVHYHWSGAVAAARPATQSLHFSAAALTVPFALHEIAHLRAGSSAHHGERFVTAFVRLVTHAGGGELAMRFQAILGEEGAGLWDSVPHRLTVA